MCPPFVRRSCFGYRRINLRRVCVCVHVCVSLLLTATHTGAFFKDEHQSFEPQTGSQTASKDRRHVVGCWSEILETKQKFSLEDEETTVEL